MGRSQSIACFVGSLHRRRLRGFSACVEAANESVREVVNRYAGIFDEEPFRPLHLNS